jgi:hypothetical protein
MLFLQVLSIHPNWTEDVWLAGCKAMVAINSKSIFCPSHPTYYMSNGIPIFVMNFTAEEHVLPWVV